MRYGSRVARSRHYVNLSSTERKLDRLLSSFQFAPLNEIVRRACNATSSGTALSNA